MTTHFLYRKACAFFQHYINDLFNSYNNNNITIGGIITVTCALSRLHFSSVNGSQYLVRHWLYGDYFQLPIFFFTQYDGQSYIETIILSKYTMCPHLKNACYTFIHVESKWQTQASWRGLHNGLDGVAGHSLYVGYWNDWANSRLATLEEKKEIEFNSVTTFKIKFG